MCESSPMLIVRSVLDKPIIQKVSSPDPDFSLGDRADMTKQLTQLSDSTQVIWLRYMGKYSSIRNVIRIFRVKLVGNKSTIQTQAELLRFKEKTLY